MNPNQPTNPPSAMPPRKVFDVMRPGQAPASPTSRPVVMSQRPGALQAQAAVSGVGETPRDYTGGQSVAAAVQPLSSAAMATPGQVATFPAQTDASALATAAMADAVTEPDLVLPGSPSSASQSVGMQPPSQAAVPQPLAAYAASSDHVLESTNPADMPTGTPIVSQHDDAGSVWPMVITIFIILLLAVAIFDLLLDAAIITIPGVPHTTFL